MHRDPVKSAIGLTALALFLALAISLLLPPSAPPNAQTTQGKFVAPDSIRTMAIYVNGERIDAIRHGTFTLDPPNVLASLSADATVTISGLDVASNWNVNVQPMSAMTAGLSVGSAWVSADNTITVRFANASILAINQGSLTFSYVAFK